MSDELRIGDTFDLPVHSWGGSIYGRFQTNFMFETPLVMCSGAKEALLVETAINSYDKLVEEAKTKDERIAELEMENMKMKMFISSVAGAMENKNVALHHLSCRAKELLVKGNSK